MTANSYQAQAHRHGDYAGFATRLVAFFIDRLIIAILVLGTIVAAAVVLTTFQLDQQAGSIRVSAKVAAIVAGVLGGLFDMIYDVGCWMLAGQTPGKRIMGLLVVQTNGKRLKLGRALLRWLGYWISGILFLGFLWILLDNRRQGFHDKVARTFVVYSRPEAARLLALASDNGRRSELAPEQGSAKNKAV